MIESFVWIVFFCYFQCFSIKLFVENIPNYAVDIPRLWEYIGELIGAFVSVSSSNMSLLRSILPLIPNTKVKELFQHIIRYAIEFSVRINILIY